MFKLVMMARNRKPNDQEEASGTEYHVKVPQYNGGEYDLVFDRRQDARDYKRSLKRSKRQLQARIIKRVYDGGFIASEEEVY